MDIKVLKNEGFTLSGSGVLRAYKNEKMVYEFLYLWKNKKNKSYFLRMKYYIYFTNIKKYWPQNIDVIK